MKWFNRILFFGLSIYVHYFLFTKFNVLNIKDFSKILTYNLLCPYPVFSGESFDFLKIISVLGSSFLNYRVFFLFLSDITEGGKNVIKFHSKGKKNYQWNLIKILFPRYSFCFIIQLISIFIASLFIVNLDYNLFSLFRLCVIWFSSELIYMLVVGLMNSSTVLTIILFPLGILLRMMLINYYFILLLGLITLIILKKLLKGKKDVKN